MPPPSAAGQQKTADPRSERKVNGLLRIKDTYLYGEDTVYSAEYTPIQKGNQYLMYLTYKDDEIYNFDGEKVLGTVGLQEAVYCLASEAEAKESVIAGDDNYWRLWNDVAQNYR